MKPIKNTNYNLKANLSANASSGTSGEPNPKKVDHDDVRATDATGDGASVGANIVDHFNDSRTLEKLNALIAGALVMSGAKKVYSGIKHRDREKFLRGSKQLIWGSYHALHGAERVFRTTLMLTPGLRAIGGLINADLGLTALVKDYKDDKKFKTDKAIFHAGAAAWGLRHLALGVEGLSRTKWGSKILSRISPAVKDALTRSPILGAVGAAMGIAGGALDACLGARLLAKGIKSGDKEKKILGLIDIGTGMAMGAACVLSGPAGIAVAAAGSLGIAYRTWRTDKKQIKKYLKTAGKKAKKVGRKIKKDIKRIFHPR